MANGSVYEGSFRKGLREGRGTMTYPNGNKYIGEWKGNKKEGQGEMEWQDAHEKYEGSWNDDLPHGEGTYYWYDSKNGSMKTIYKGGWNQGRRSGLGGFLYANGARFEGSFRDNLKEGFSIMTDENGEHRLQVYQHDRLLKSRYTAHEETGICDNPYAKILALCCPEADGLVANYLLRENSLIRNWYKILSQPDSDSFVGVTLESMWRIIRETKLLNDGLSLPRLNR